MAAARTGSVASPYDEVAIARASRLAAKVLEAFGLACEMGDLDTAENMLKAADEIMQRQGLAQSQQPGPQQWHAASQGLVDAHFRLWELRYLAR